MEILFYLIAAITVIFALAVILHRKVIYAAVFLIVVQVCIAFCFYLLGSTVLGMFQLIIYAGAIMVLFLFIIMVLGPGSETRQDSRLPGQWLLVFLTGLALLFVGVKAWPMLAPGGEVNSSIASEIEVLGRIILIDYLYLFELVSVVLLTAMVAVVMLTKRSGTK